MNILVFAPHNDDETLGAGGTIAKLALQGHDVYVCEVTSGPNETLVEKIKNEAKKAHKILGVKESIFLDLPVVALKDSPTVKVNGAFQGVVNRVKPQIAFIPHKGDMHIDHFETAMAAMVALRPISNPQLKAVYAYETLSETEWNIPSSDNLFVPNVWCDITSTYDYKIRAMKCYETQLQQYPNPRSLEAIEALAKYRGSTICVGYAESFMLIRNII